MHLILTDRTLPFRCLQFIQADLCPQQHSVDSSSKSERSGSRTSEPSSCLPLSSSRNDFWGALLLCRRLWEHVEEQLSSQDTVQRTWKNRNTQCVNRDNGWLSHRPGSYYHLHSFITRIFVSLIATLVKTNTPSPYTLALTMSTKAGFKLAPPTRKPSMSCSFARSLQFFSLTLPP